jgi:hypothetical protein
MGMRDRIELKLLNAFWPMINEVSYPVIRSDSYKIRLSSCRTYLSNLIPKRINRSVMAGTNERQKTITILLNPKCSSL